MKPTSSSLQKLTNLLRARTVIRALPPKTVIPVHVLAMIEQYHPPPAPPPIDTAPAGRTKLVGRSSSATQHNDGLPYETTPKIRRQQQHSRNPPYLEPLSFASAVALRCRQQETVLSYDGNQPHTEENLTTKIESNRIFLRTQFIEEGKTWTSILDTTMIHTTHTHTQNYNITIQTQYKNELVFFFFFLVLYVRFFFPSFCRFVG